MTALSERVTTLPTLLVLPPSFSNVSIPPKIKIDLPIKIDQSFNHSLKTHLVERGLVTKEEVLKPMEKVVELRGIEPLTS